MTNLYPADLTEIAKAVELCQQFVVDLLQFNNINVEWANVLELRVWTDEEVGVVGYTDDGEIGFTTKK